MEIKKMFQTLLENNLKAFESNEVPISSLIIHKTDHEEIVYGPVHNLTNLTKNSTLHCEMILL